MVTLNEVKLSDWERVAHITDPESGLNAFIAVHDSAVGNAPATRDRQKGQGVSLGGIRMRAYGEPQDEPTIDSLSEDERATLQASTDQERRALEDVIRLSRGMTFKSAHADTGLGGGKAVIIADPKQYPEGSPQREKLMKAMGAGIQKFAETYPDSIYVGAEDMNTKPSDMKIIEGVTQHISGTGHDEFNGNPSPFTAEGGLAALKVVLGDDLRGKKVAISGVGSVGGALAKMLHKEGAELVLSDIDDKPEKLKAELGGDRITVVPNGEIHKQETDAWVPAAIGGVINDRTVDEINAKNIVPIANNVLAEPRHGQRLDKRGITYVPDYLSNAGGIIAVGMEVERKRAGKPLTLAEISETVDRKVMASVTNLLKYAKENNIAPSDAADQLGEEIVARAAKDAQMLKGNDFFTARLDRNITAARERDWTARTKRDSNGQSGSTGTPG